MENNVKIFVCYHKQTPIFQSECIIPIHVGKANSKLELDMIGDNTGDNISEKNGSWCELTALYWMWKNVHADYYGLFHYRRFLDFNSIGGGYQIFNEFNDKTIEKFGLTDDKIKDVCSKYDVITSPIWGIHPVGIPHLLQTNYEFYAKDHFAKDLDLVIELIKEKSPEIYPYAIKSLYAKESFFANMMILKKEHFNNYCTWLFDILFEAEKRVDISEYDSYQKRIWGFIAERLANCYLEYLKSSVLNFKSTCLGMAYGVFDVKKYDVNTIIDNVNKNKELNYEVISNSPINIAFAIDDNYAKHCAGAITSVLDNANKNQKINFFIMCNDKFSHDIRKLMKKFESENVTMSFLEVNISDFTIYPLNRKHISIATYYRLALHKMLPDNVQKIIYLDADLVVLDNIANLWNHEFDDNYLVGSPDEGGVTQNRRLNLPVSHNYINAGICMMNIAKMRKSNLEHLFAEAFYRNKEYITLQDQDILNIAFVNKIGRAHCKWNVQSRFYKPFNELEYNYSLNEEMEALMTPSIVHYSDREKPWQLACSHPLKFYYEKYQALLSSEWDEFQPKKTINDIICRTKTRKNVEIKIMDNNNVRVMNFNGRLNREIGKIVYKVLRAYYKLKLGL